MNPNRRRHGLGRGQVEHVGGGDPAAGELEQRAGDGEQRVGAGERAVGELDPELVGGVAVARPAGSGGREPEPGRDQRREGLDVGAHHEDVARLERRVVLEQPDQHLAQHVDLAGRAVAGVHLEAAVVVGEAAAGALGDGRGVVGAQVVPGASRAGCRASRQARPPCGRRRDRRRASRRSSRVSRPSEASSGWPTRLGGRVVVARHHAAEAGQVVPQRAARAAAARGGRRGCSPSASQQLDLGDREPGVAEQRQPRRQVEPLSARAQAREGLGVPDVGRRLVDPGEQPPPELGLPDAGRRRAAPPAPSVSRPSRQSVTSVGRWTAYDAKRPASRRATE